MNARMMCFGLTLLSLSAFVPGRVTAAINLLSNPSFEVGLTGWTTDHATTRSSNPSPHSGRLYLFGAADGAGTSYTHQTVDLIGSGFSASVLDSGALTVAFGGWQSGWYTQTDSGKIEIILRDGALGELAREDLGWFYSNHTWTLLEGATAIPIATRYIDFGFYARRTSGFNTDGYLDDAFLRVSQVPEPSMFMIWTILGAVVTVAGVRVKRR